MIWTFSENIEASAVKGYRFLRNSLHALEREALRTAPNATLSKLPHPESLGSPLLNPSISTDFSEAQLELITPPFRDERRTLSFLNDIQHYIVHSLQDTTLWPSSIPCILPSDEQIPLARYGTSRRGILKEIYRRGLGLRYGRAMQTLSGIHYNFSFSPEFWDFFQSSHNDNRDRSTFISESYLHISRNFLREGWILTYLFGASPAADTSFFRSTPKALQKSGRTYYGKYATSLRMSDYGYYNKVQLQHSISFNSLDNYIHDLDQALHTTHKDFTALGLVDTLGRRQLNDNLLQIESEHYSRIRPKPHLDDSLSPLESLRKNGIRYVEVRSPDISPFTAEGIDLTELQFLHVFMVYCLFKESPYLSPSEQDIITKNQNDVALYGRNPFLQLHNGDCERSLPQWGRAITDDMKKVADLMDKNYKDNRYRRCIEKQIEKLNNPVLTPSARILEEVEKAGGFISLMSSYAQYHKEILQRTPLPPHIAQKFSSLAQHSLQRQKELEMRDDFILEGYEDLEISTQALIRGALERSITVEVIDRKDNFIMLAKDNICEYVKQATKTSKDSLTTYLLMESKFMTKYMLEKHALSTPKGALYTSKHDAHQGYDIFRNIHVAVKPNFTNYGIGISFCPPHDENSYNKALDLAFQYSSEVIVEEFIEGKEYRFLVIDGKVSAACQRIPAHIVGDGIHTIRELIAIKNADPRCHKVYPIKTGKKEKELLAQQELSLLSIPAKKQKVFLRTNSNVSTGGDSVDMTDDIHEGYKTIAIEAARAVNATFCGVDMIVKDRTDAPSDGSYSIIELNFNPALLIHRYPTRGKKRYVEHDVLDALGFPPL